MTAREIVTLQLGNYSNFIGTHWWNLQESSFIFSSEEAAKDDTRINHYTLFRKGLNYCNQPTLTPRLVALDSKDNVGNSDLSGNLYSLPDHGAHFASRDASLIEMEKRPQNKFLIDVSAVKDSNPQKKVDSVGLKYYDLDCEVEYWSDFVKIPYHPRSLVTTPADISSHEMLSRWETGWEYEREVVEEVEERVRKYVEEADLLQGFHVLFDMHDAFSGISCRIIQHLHEEYRGSAILALPSIPTWELKHRKEQSVLIWNIARSIETLNEDVSVWIPLSLTTNPLLMHTESRNLPHVNFEPRLPYHTSAILAAALESATTSWRTMQRPDHLISACSELTRNGCKMGNACVSFPWDVKESAGKYISDICKSETTGIPTLGFSPCTGKERKYSATKLPISDVSRFSLRGLNKFPFLDGLPAGHDFRRYRNPSEMFDAYFSSRQIQASWYLGLQPVYTRSPFPNLFDVEVGRDGLIDVNNTRPQQTVVDSVPVFTELWSTCKENPFLTEIHASLQDTSLRPMYPDKDLLEETSSSIASEILHNYSAYC